MKFNVNVKEFIRALEASHEVATKNTTKEFPYSEKITIAAEKDKFLVYAFGGVVSIISSNSNLKNSELKYECIEEGKVTVNSKSFSSYLETFPPQEFIEISVDKKDFLKMTLISNRKEHCGTPIYEDHVETFKVAESFSQQIDINREIFLRGYNKVLFGATDIEKYYYYHCIVLESDGHNVMFSSGTGSRFVIDIIEGNSVISSSTGNINIKMPSKHSSTIKKILENATSQNIIVKYSAGDEAKAIPEQIVFEFNDVLMCIKDIAKFENYPSLSPVLKNSYENKVSCLIKDWTFPIKRIMATFNDHDGEVHNTEVSISGGKMTWKTQTKIEATGDIPFDTDKNKTKYDESQNVWFMANSEWLKDMAMCNQKPSTIEINFDNQEYLNRTDLTKEEIRKFKKKPVLVKYEEDKDTIKDISEKFYLFFVIAS